MNMKKAIKISLAVCAVLASVCACDNYDNPYEGSNGYDSSIKIVSSDVFFSAEAGEGSIEVQSEGDFTAATSVGWCHLSTDGNKINVKVDEARSRVGRSAVIVIRNENDSVKVPCIQKGFSLISDVPSSFTARNSGATKKYLFDCNLKASLSTSADWVTAKVEGDSLVVTVNENTSEKPRTGWVAYSVGEEKDTLSFSQLDADKLIPGRYEIPGYMYGLWNKDHVAEAVVELYNENGSVDLANLGKKNVVIYNVTFPKLIQSTDGSLVLTPIVQLAYNPDGGYISWMTSKETVNSSECRYKSGTKYMYVFSSLVNTAETKSNGTGGIKLVIPRNSFGHYIAFPEVDEDGNLCWRFKSSGLYEAEHSGKSFDGWGLGMFLNKSFTTSNIKNFYFISKNMVMTKVGDL